MKKTKAEIKYEQILYRDFENKMEMFIYSNNFPELSNEDNKMLNYFKDFIDSRDEDKILNYVKENQDYELAYKLDKKYKKYNRLFLKEKNKYYKIFDKDFRAKFNFEEFYKKYGEDKHNRKCEYCGITEDHIKSLLCNGGLRSKSLWNRGRFMEIDRKNPLDGYSADNIALCCYWCNNAKTDEFDYEEFKIIRRGITTIWNNRIKNIKNNEFGETLPSIWSNID